MARSLPPYNQLITCSGSQGADHDRRTKLKTKSRTTGTWHFSCASSCRSLCRARRVIKYHTAPHRATLHPAPPRRIAPRRAAPRRAAPRCAAPRRAPPRRTAPHPAGHCRTLPPYHIPCRTIQDEETSCDAMPFGAMRCKRRCTCNAACVVISTLACDCVSLPAILSVRVSTATIWDCQNIIETDLCTRYYVLCSKHSLRLAASSRTTSARLIGIVRSVHQCVRI